MTWNEYVKKLVTKLQSDINTLDARKLYFSFPSSSLSDHVRSRINQSESQFKTGTFDFHYVEYSHNWNSLIFVRIISAQYVS